MINAPFEKSKEAVPFFPVTMIDFSSTFFPTEESFRVTLNSSSIESEKTSPLTEVTITEASTAPNSLIDRWKKIKNKNKNSFSFRLKNLQTVFVDMFFFKCHQGILRNILNNFPYSQAIFV